MPSVAARPCLGTGCTATGTWPRGRCPACARYTNQQRGSAHSRGYTSTWQRFRVQFIAQLVQQNIRPVCGATLPTGPQAVHSLCKGYGLSNSDDLHLDHEPPLTDAERHDPRVVMDPQRIQLLCQRCHNAKTRSEQSRTGWNQHGWHAS